MSGIRHYSINMPLRIWFRKDGDDNQLAAALRPARMAVEDRADVTPCR
jgi:hypothetical protein